MSKSAQSMAHFAGFRRMGAMRWIFAAAVVGATTLSVPADAQARIIRAGAYDGTWNVTFATHTPCSIVESTRVGAFCSN
jgi:hypothetical protein